MKLLVTGGTGFVGGHVAAAAVRAGHDVRLLARRPAQVPVTMGLLQWPLPPRWHFPADPEGAALIACSTVFDDTSARTELGVDPLPFEQSLRDTVVWLVESGRMPSRYAGRALEPQE
jgi:hypothetical protein